MRIDREAKWMSRSEIELKSQCVEPFTNIIYKGLSFLISGAECLISKLRERPAKKKVRQVCKFLNDTGWTMILITINLPRAILTTHFDLNQKLKLSYVVSVISLI